MACGPNRVPGRWDVPPSNGAPSTTTSAPAKDAGSSRSHRSTPRKVMSGPYWAPYLIATSLRGLPLSDGGTGPEAPAPGRPSGSTTAGTSPGRGAARRVAMSELDVRHDVLDPGV